MPIVATDPFTDLVLHVLAHARAPGPADLFDAGYVAWAQTRLPADLVTALHADADLIARTWTGDDALAVQAWPELHDDWAAFVATRDRALAELGPRDVARPDVLAVLQRCDRIVGELLHGQIALLAPAFARLHAEIVTPTIAATMPAVAAHVREAVALAPQLAGTRIELAWPLGPRGRGFTHRIVVGAPAPWNGLDAATPAVLALHEHAVRSAATSDHVQAEWSAIVACVRAMAGASTPLRAAHARWIEMLELGPLLAALVQCGTIDGPTAAALRDPATRRAALARISAAPAGAGPAAG